VGQFLSILSCFCLIEIIRRCWIRKFADSKFTHVQTFLKLEYAPNYCYIFQKNIPWSELMNSSVSNCVSGPSIVVRSVCPLTDMADNHTNQLILLVKKIRSIHWAGVNHVRITWPPFTSLANKCISSIHVRIIYALTLSDELKNNRAYENVCFSQSFLMYYL